MIRVSSVSVFWSLPIAQANLTQGGVIVTQDFLDKLHLNGKTTLISTITAIYDIGCFFGAVSVIVIGEPLGRKKCVLLGTTIMSVGAILQIASFGTAQMIVGRYVQT
jgi:MFS family permease